MIDKPVGLIYFSHTLFSVTLLLRDRIKRHRKGDQHRTMYLRDSQGRLRWFPPAAQGLDPFADPGDQTYAMHHAMIRQQMQQEEWMRFNAPPAGDQMHFDAGAAPTEFAPAASRHPVSMGTMISMGNDPRFFNNGLYPPNGPGAMPFPRQQFQLPSPSPRGETGAFAGGPLAPDQMPLSPRKNNRTPPSKSKMAVLPSDTNVSCMNTLFGSQVKPQYPNVSGIMACNQVDPPFNPEVDFKLPPHFNMDRFASGASKKTPENTTGMSKLSNPMQVFHCNGVRGPPKKFDYSFKPKLPECHANRDIFYDALEEESPGSDPPAPEDILSVHDSFDEKTFLMDVESPAPLPPRKKKSTPRKKVTRRKTRKSKDPKENLSPEPIMEEREPKSLKVGVDPMQESREPESLPSRDSIEQNRDLLDSPQKTTKVVALDTQKTPVVALKVHKQPVCAIRQAPEVVPPEIESEDSKDAMYASVTNRKKPDPVHVPHQYTGPAAIISPKDIVQKIASRDFVPSPETVPANQSRDPPAEEAHVGKMAQEAPVEERKPPSRSRSCRPKSRSKSKTRRSKSAKKIRVTELTFTDQVALAQSIRQICLEATPELNGDEYPSFDEPKPKDGEQEGQPGRDSPATESTGSSGGENKQQAANKEEKKKRRSKKEKSKRSSSVRRSTSTKKEKSTQPNSNGGILRNAEERVFSERMQRLRGECKAWLPTEPY
jgi:hypothetical protein